MKKLLLIAALFVCASGVTFANDEPVVSEPLAVVEPGKACPPVAPVCAPKPTVCATPASKTLVEETRTVPVKRQVIEDETYTENVTHTAYSMEERTRQAQRKIRVADEKRVAYVDAKMGKPRSGKAPRLSRKVQNKMVPTTRIETEVYEENYVVRVPVTYTEPVEKTRKVIKYVDDVETVTVRTYR